MATPSKRLKKLARAEQARTGVRYTEALATVRSRRVPAGDAMSENDHVDLYSKALQMGALVPWKLVVPGRRGPGEPLSIVNDTVWIHSVQVPDGAVLQWLGVSGSEIPLPPEGVQRELELPSRRIVLAGQEISAVTSNGNAVAVNGYKLEPHFMQRWMEDTILRFAVEQPEHPLSPNNLLRYLDTLDFDELLQEAMRCDALKKGQFDGLGCETIEPGAAAVLHTTVNRNYYAVSLILDSSEHLRTDGDAQGHPWAMVEAVTFAGLPMNIGARGAPVLAFAGKGMDLGHISCFVGQKVQVHLRNVGPEKVIVSGGILCHEFNPYAFQEALKIVDPNNDGLFDHVAVLREACKYMLTR